MASYAYAAASLFAHRGELDRTDLGVGVMVAMGVWTVAATILYAAPVRRRWPLLVTDLVITVAALLSSGLILTDAAIESGDPTVTVSWAAAPVLAWAIWGGPLGGTFAAVVVAIADIVERGDLTQSTANGIVLLLLAGGVVGYVVQLARRAEAAYAEAVHLRAAADERERLSRQIHDGVLQALALVSRRSTDPELAVLAGEQEVQLRRLVAGPAVTAPGEADLRELLPAGPSVSVAAPATPVRLPAHVAAELTAATKAAVDNALQHGGRQVWLLLEDEPDAVTVSVRDDGPGMPAGRLAEAEAAGRLGVARSIRGRIEDLGGTVQIDSAPGRGTEVELRVPRG